MHGALNPPNPMVRERVSVWVSSGGVGKNGAYTLPVCAAAATRGRRTNVAEARSMGEVRGVLSCVECRSLACSSSRFLIGPLFAELPFAPGASEP